MPAKRNWIQSVLRPSKRGALHRQLGIPQAMKIPGKVLRWASQQAGVLGRRARLAMNLRAIGARRKRKRR
ncbi:MAG: hypothetical protein Q8S13_07405 [Dehalococcoidia bacterium]|nr:hypothetical protein [Dehalococcoidia bacterium]